MEGELTVKHTSSVIYATLPDGSKAFIRYSVEGKVMKLLETYTPPQFRGQGIAAKLMDYAVKMARESGYAVEPVCSYAIYYFLKNRHLRELLAEPYRSMTDDELRALFEKRKEEEKRKPSDA